MNRTEKQEFITEIQEQLLSSKAVIVTHYHGLTVSQITNLRKRMREVVATFRFAKNSLTKIAISDSTLDSAKSRLVGPVALAYSDDLVGLAKVLVKFAKENNNLKILGGIVENKEVNSDGVTELSNMLSLDELRAKIVGIISTPARNLVGVLQAPASQLARILSAYASKK